MLGSGSRSKTFKQHRKAKSSADTVTDSEFCLLEWILHKEVMDVDTQPLLQGWHCEPDHETVMHTNPLVTRLHKRRSRLHIFFSIDSNLGQGQAMGMLRSCFKIINEHVSEHFPSTRIVTHYGVTVDTAGHARTAARSLVASLAGRAAPAKPATICHKACTPAAGHDQCSVLAAVERLLSEAKSEAVLAGKDASWKSGLTGIDDVPWHKGSRLVVRLSSKFSRVFGSRSETPPAAYQERHQARSTTPSGMTDLTDLVRTFTPSELDSTTADEVEGQMNYEETAEREYIGYAGELDVSVKN
ncbi:hypothetical protein WJX72_007205 [[Myrmecia] bisecta]|uniref:Uncharacterized protein n=1 Tax=[Myrmecia] bisecta TaxID=41462 RepID=A0AAW1R7Y9_9CHLO